MAAKKKPSKVKSKKAKSVKRLRPDPTAAAEVAQRRADGMAKHRCLCPHEDCGQEFDHFGTTTETTCCPSCGRQQAVHLKEDESNSCPTSAPSVVKTRKGRASATKRSSVEKGEQGSDPTSSGGIQSQPATSTPSRSHSGTSSSSGLDKTDTKQTAGTEPASVKPAKQLETLTTTAREHVEGDAGFDKSLVSGKCRCKACKALRADASLIRAVNKTITVRDGDSLINQKPPISEFADGPSQCRNIPGQPDTLPDEMIAVKSPIIVKTRPAMHDVPKLSGLAAKVAEARQKAAQSPKTLPPHVVVSALAGTGKTFTLVVGVVYMFRDRVPSLWPLLISKLGFEPVASPQQQAVWNQMRLSADANTVQFCAFNKSIVAEFEHKWGWVVQELAKHGIRFGFNTNHSLGNRAVFKAYGKVKLNEYKVVDVIGRLLDTDVRELRKTKPNLLKAGEELVGLCKQILVGLDRANADKDFWRKELGTLISHYDVDTEGVEQDVLYALVPAVLEECANVMSTNDMDYNDMIWLPVACNLPIHKADLLLVDERQDLSKAQQELSFSCGRRIIAVGDEQQAIYGFAGSDADACVNYEKRLRDTDRGVVVLPLTVTRRCGKRIVAEARRYVPEFRAHESNPEGEICNAKYPEQRKGQGEERQTIHLPWEQTYGPLVKDGDLVLCRTNAPLVRECFRFIKRGIKATIQGRDVGKGLTTLLSKLCKDQDTHVTELVAKLSDWLHRETAKENAKRNPSESRIEMLQDKHDCLCCFTEGANTVVDVIAKIQAVFTDDKDVRGIRFSSIHRAKGQEAERVFILRPAGTGPRTDKMKGWELVQESNIVYVGITRAIKVLTYVT